MDNKAQFTSFQPTLLIYNEDQGHTIDCVRSLLSENVIEGLFVSTENCKESLDFLHDFDFIEVLSVAGSSKNLDCSFLHKTTSLRILSMFSDGNKIVDLSSLLCLRMLVILWRKNKIRGLGRCRNLVDITIWSYKELDFGQFRTLSKLKRLSVKTGSMKNLDGLEGCRSLEILSLAGCRYLTDISKLSELPSLKSLHLDSCSQVHDFSVLSKLPNLERLWIEDTRNIESISFLRDMPQLKEFCVIGNCSITDGDLSPALNTLAQITPKKHYNMEILPPDWRQRGGSSYGWWIDPIDLGD